MDQENTSPSLLDLLREGNPDGWQQFSQVYGRMVYVWCRSRQLDVSTSSDVAQDVFVAVVKNVAKFRKERQEDTFRGWLWMITQNKIRDYYRKLAKNGQATGGSTANAMLAQLAQEDSLSACDLLNSDHESLLAQALQQVQNEVKDSTWKAFWRTTIDGLDTESAAQELSISPGSVRVNRFRVLSRLRELLSGCETNEVERDDE